MLFLVDGYNVTMNDPATRGASKEAQRDALLRRLGASGRAMLGAGTIVAVFDAREQLGLSSERVAGVSAVFAPDADTEIVRRCGRANEAVVVVSNDMRLRARISQDVARRVEYRDASSVFEGAGRGEARRDKRPQVAREEGLPSGANDITAELKKLWLDEDDEG